MHPRHHIWLLMALLGTGCAQLHDKPPAAESTRIHPAMAGADLSPGRAATLMRQSADLDSHSARTQISHLKSTLQQNGVAERLQLAYLLSREYRNAEDLHQADALVEELIPALQDTDTRELARLLQRNIRLQLMLGEESGKVVELTRKIQQIKGLEKELQQHNLTDDPARTPPDK